MRHVHKKRMSKAKNQRYHAKIRMLQHYGKQITNFDLDRMAEVYRYTEDKIILVKQSNRVKKALIWYKGEVYPIIYDKVRRQIVTILKVEYLTPKQQVIFNNFKNQMIAKESKNQNTVVPQDMDLDIEEDAVEDDVDYPPEDPYFEDDLTDEENQQLMKEAFEDLPNF